MMWFKTKRWFFRTTGMKFTSETWQWLFPEIQVLDPDGWDRRPKYFGFQWYIQLLTYDEYIERVTWSTVQFEVKFWE